MPTEAEIKAPYITVHAELEYCYYTLHELPKEEFDQLHGANWDAMEAELIAEGYRVEPKPSRDLGAEIDELKVEVAKLKGDVVKLKEGPK